MLRNGPRGASGGSMKREVVFLLVVLGIVLVANILLGRQQTADLGTYPSGRRLLYTSISTHSQYLKMDDGIRLAVDILLPENLPPGTRLPAIIRWTRDGRATRDGNPAPLDTFFVDHGYARISVDERGSGASF